MDEGREEEERRMKQWIERRRVCRWESANTLLEERGKVNREGLGGNSPLRLPKCTPSEGGRSRDLSIYLPTSPRRSLDWRVLLRGGKRCFHRMNIC